VIDDREVDAKSARPRSHSRFGIGFDHRDRIRLHELWDQVLDSEIWTEGKLVDRFERAWAQWNGLPSVATGSWAGAAAAALRFADVRGQVVLCPSNTFMATPLSVLEAGGAVEFVDCNRADLCVSFHDFEEKAERHRPRAAWLVHIGGHIAFDVEQISAYCGEKGIFLIEDCAHAHGGSWHGRRPGSWGDAGIYSLYATKTISTGEGGMLVTRHPELAEFARRFRNYGKPDFDVHGTSARMSEFTAAIGLVALERLDEIVAWKNAVAREELDHRHPGRLEMPEGMVSGLYKYIVFDPLTESAGKVYDRPCHRVLGHAVELPQTDWVAANHWCVPLYYRGGRSQEAET
jgi:perosamine synthetase